MKKLFALVLVSLIVAGCAQSAEVEEVASPIQESEQALSDTSEEVGLTDEEKQALLDKIAEEEALAAELKKNTEDAEQRNDAAADLRRRVILGIDGAIEGEYGLKWWPHTKSLDCDQDDFKQPTSLDELDVCGTFLSAWSQVWKQMESAKANPLDIKFYVSPATPKSEVASEKSLLERSTLLWGANFWQTGQVVYVSTGSQSELDWFQNQISQLGGLPYMFSGAGEIEDWYWGPEQSTGCGALSSQLNGVYTLLSCTPQTFPSNLKVTPHEYTHWYYGQFGELNNEGPLWFIEGAAEFFGMAIGFKDEPLAGPYRSNVLQFHSGLALHQMDAQVDLLTTLQSMDESEFVRMMTQQEDKWEGSAGFGYFIGAMATEALLAVYGPEKVDDFARSFVSGSNWKPAFREVFGIQVKDFYTKLMPYVVGTAREMRVLD